MRLLHALLLLVAVAPQLGAAAPSPERAPQAATKGSLVSLEVADNQDTPSGVGFVISIGGWKPSGMISVYLIGPKGEQIAVVPKERETKVSPEGLATFDIPYQLRGLYAGQWQLVVAGESGIHLKFVSIP